MRPRSSSAVAALATASQSSRLVIEQPAEERLVPAVATLLPTVITGVVTPVPRPGEEATRRVQVAAAFRAAQGLGACMGADCACGAGGELLLAMLNDLVQLATAEPNAAAFQPAAWAGHAGWRNSGLAHCRCSVVCLICLTGVRSDIRSPSCVQHQRSWSLFSLNSPMIPGGITAHFKLSRNASNQRNGSRRRSGSILSTLFGGSSGCQHQSPLIDAHCRRGSWLLLPCVVGTRCVIHPARLWVAGPVRPFTLPAGVQVRRQGPR
jgi:hypothetical protein